jgi:hypothetical protein
MTFPTTPASFITLNQISFSATIAPQDKVSLVGTHNIAMSYTNGLSVVTNVSRVVTVTKDCDTLDWVWNTADSTQNV